MSNARLASKQVAPLPIGPGGKHALKNQMNDANTRLTLLNAQATANTLYDPPVPPPLTAPRIEEKFCSPSSALPSWVAAIGWVLIAYGLLSK